MTNETLARFHDADAGPPEGDDGENIVYSLASEPPSGHSAAEQTILDQYHQNAAAIKGCQGRIVTETTYLKELVAEGQRLHRLAVVIDPSLKRTRAPKATP